MTPVGNELLQELLKFRRDRDWQQFHTPRNLSAALVTEAAELLECFQWARDAELVDLVARERQAIEDEIADVAILLSYLCNDLDVDLDSAVRKKLRKNEAKYPVHLAHGTAKKYDKF
ncbi:nucleotide pyrophosphohydrolase [Lysobacter sp. D1-1-M9]|uniref:nucleotide pyrophosphohydrolase n=1 Tax=Novilysobacter longmucuonensis TaxID=3098603 RepID=UPI002FC5E6F8